jgi:hypothetical protein
VKLSSGQPGCTKSGKFPNDGDYKMSDHAGGLVGNTHSSGS